MPWALRVYARMMEMREEQRFTWEHILARQRRMVLDAGVALVEKGVLPQAKAVWLLGWEELRDAMVEGTVPSSEALCWRRHEQRLYAAMHPPAIMTPGVLPTANAGPTLQGAGASPGIARGRVVLSHWPSELRSLAEGSILVTRALDPACSGIMRHAAGLVVERGGLLSHASILAREYGVPLVIGVEGAIELLKEGEEVEVDGGRGVVTILHRHSRESGNPGH